jgi:multidrug efflux system membrane fusion protein
MAVRPNTLKSRKWPALALAIVTLALLAYVIWRADTAPGTDDAYAQADTIDVVPEVSGRIVEMAVRDNQRVNRGDLLFRVDPRPFADELARANASLVALDKQIALTRRVVTAQQYGADSVHALVERARVAAAQTAETLRRTQPLLAPGYVSAEDVDRARTAQRAAEADLTAARLQAQQAASAVTGVDALVAQRDVVLADIALMQLRLDMATVRAPFDGRVVSLKTSVGQFASALKPVFTLIDTEHWYVIANFRETELKNIRAGTPATVYRLRRAARRRRPRARRTAARPAQHQLGAGGAAFPREDPRRSTRRGTVPDRRVSRRAAKPAGRQTTPFLSPRRTWPTTCRSVSGLWQAFSARN